MKCKKCENIHKLPETGMMICYTCGTVHEESQIIGIIQSQGIISAVKWYKDKYNCGLKEAKDYVDNIAAKHNVVSGGGSGSGCSIIVLIGISLTLGAIAIL